MRAVRLGALIASALAVAAASAGAAGAATSKEGTGGVPKLETTATAAEACEVVFGADAFEKAPSEGEVAPGEAVSVDVTWGTGWQKGSTVEVLGCTAVDGEFSEELSTRIRKVKNDGLFVHEFTVPKTVAKGAVLCERAIVIGLSAAGSAKAERLDADCFTVSGAAKPVADAKPAPEVAGPSKTVSPKPAEKTEAAASKPADAKPAAKTEPAAAPKPAPAAAKTPVVAGETETKPAAAADATLARTGPANGMLAVAAGLMFMLGGCAVAFGRPLRGALR